MRVVEQLSAEHSVPTPLLELGPRWPRPEVFFNRSGLPSLSRVTRSDLRGLSAFAAQILAAYPAPPSHPSPVRRLLLDLAVPSISLSDHIVSLDASVNAACRVEMQWWRKDHSCPLRLIRVFHVLFPGKETLFPVWEGSLTPLWSTQIPPSEPVARREFDSTVVLALDVDEMGVFPANRLLNPVAMSNLGFDDSAIALAKGGVPLDLHSPLRPFSLPGGHSRRTLVRALELAKSDKDRFLPGPVAGKSMFVGPLSFVPWIVVPCFPVESASGAVRIVSDHTRSGLNGALKPVPVSLPSLDLVYPLLSPSAELAVFDFSAAFCHLAISFTKCVAFGRVDLETGAALVRVNLDFGTSPGPAYAQLIAENLMRCLRERHVICVTYIDDSIIIAPSGCLQDHVDMFRTVTRDIGLTINESKVQQGHNVVYLGAALSSLSGGRASIPPDKCEKISSLIGRIKSLPSVSMASLASLIGKLSWCIPFIPRAAPRLMLLYKQLWGEFETEEPVDSGGHDWFELSVETADPHFRKCFRGSLTSMWFRKRPKWEPSRLIILLPQSLSLLQWWHEALSSQEGIPLYLGKSFPGRWRSNHSLGDVLLAASSVSDIPAVVSDACKDHSRAAGGFWALSSSWFVNFTDRPDWRDLSINFLELSTMSMAVQVTGPSLLLGSQDRRLVVVGDNDSAVAIINNGCSSSPLLNQEVMQLLDFCYDNDIEITARYVSSTSNVRADQLSRKMIPSSVNCFVPSPDLLAAIETALQRKVVAIRPDPAPTQALAYALRRLSHSWDLLLSSLPEGLSLFIPALSDVQGFCQAVMRSSKRPIVLLLVAAKSILHTPWWRNVERLATCIWRSPPGDNNKWLLSLHSMFSSLDILDSALHFCPCSVSFPLEAWLFP